MYVASLDAGVAQAPLPVVSGLSLRRSAVAPSFRCIAAVHLCVSRRHTTGSNAGLKESVASCCSCPVNLSHYLPTYPRSSPSCQQQGFLGREEHLEHPWAATRYPLLYNGLYASIPYLPNATTFSHRPLLHGCSTSNPPLPTQASRACLLAVRCVQVWCLRVHHPVLPYVAHGCGALHERPHHLDCNITQNAKLGTI